MKSTIKRIMLSALLLAFAGIQSASAAANGYRYRGLSAQINTVYTDEAGCIFQEVWLFAGKEMVHEPPGPADSLSRVIVSISREDICSGTILDVHGSAPLSDTDFQIDRKLETATLTVSVPVSNAEGDISFDALIDVTWTGISPLGHQDDHSQVRYDGYHLNHHAKGDFRYAQASGTISDGITNFLPDNSLVWGFLYNAREGNVSIEPFP